MPDNVMFAPDEVCLFIRAAVETASTYYYYQEAYDGSMASRDAVAMGKSDHSAHEAGRT
jgi:hypothetical protein